MSATLRLSFYVPRPLMVLESLQDRSAMLSTALVNETLDEISHTTALFTVHMLEIVQNHALSIT